MRTKLWILGAALSLLAAAPASALKVYRASSEGVADVKVNVTDSKGRADCIIYVASSEGQANGNARWYYEPSAGTADVRIFFTDSAGLADKTVFFTTSEGLAKCDVDWKSYKKTVNSAPRGEIVVTERSPPRGVHSQHDSTKHWKNTFRESHHRFERISAELTHTWIQLIATDGSARWSCWARCTVHARVTHQLTCLMPDFSDRGNFSARTRAFRNWHRDGRFNLRG